ncbi:MAG TPA: 2-phospho-L-lactate transferase [Candidatus Bathyarchaeia archaeon]|nr:2-phospho-L-lactate transferase [Candidatus Bathyarchaeia archaeon]
MIVVLSGGTGGAKLLQGLQHLVPHENLTVVVNTADDLQWWGLHVSPDVDSVLYALAGALSADRGWGIEHDSFRCLERMTLLGQPAWFSLGDLDLATHLTRTNLLRAGRSLSNVTAELGRRMGVRTRVLPMSDDRVATIVDTPGGSLNFQEYFVRERHQVEVRAVHFEGADHARPAPGVIESIQSAEAVIFAPSNPVTSIGPILAVPGIREALRHTAAPIAAVSPIIGGEAFSGPAGTLMKRKGWPSTIAGVAQAYEDFLDVLIVDLADHADADHLREGGLHVLCANTVMKSMQDKLELARFTLHAALQARGTKS